MNGHLAIGIDIGGTTMSVGLVEDKGSVLVVDRTPTGDLKTNAALCERMFESILCVLRGRESALVGIGAACKGTLNTSNGTIQSPALPCLDGFHLEAALRQRFGLPVRVENNADAALLGETTFGACRGAHSAALLSLGTGVGGALVLDGVLWRGFEGQHPEIGHLPVRPDDPPCYCGIAGCLESVASGAAIATAGRASTDAVFEAAKNGSNAAETVICRAVDGLARAVRILAIAYVPEVVVLRGSVFDNHASLFLGACERALAAPRAVLQRSPRVTPGQLGSDAGVIGAAAAVLGL